MQNDDDGVCLFCEWVENGILHQGYKFFTWSEYEQMLTEENEKINPKGAII